MNGGNEMKKLLSSILIMVTLLTFNQVKASSLPLINSYQLVEAQATYTNGLYLVQAACRDESDLEQITYFLEYLGSCSKEVITEDNLDTLLASDFGVTCSDEGIRNLITYQAYNEEDDRYIYGILVKVVGEFSADEFNSYMPENYGIYYLSTASAPEISPAIETHVLNYDEHFTLDDIKARYTATDNYDHDLTDQIEFTSNFPTNEDEYKLGEYYITATVRDSSGNQTSVTHQIYLVDITKPKFNVEVVSKEYAYGTELDLAAILADINCVDNYDGAISYDRWELTPAIDFSSLQPQEIKVSVKDTSDNEASFILNILFKDEEAPVISVNMIDISTTNPLSADEIVKLLVKGGQIPANYLSYQLTTDYFDYQDKIGIHDATLEVIYPNKTSNYRFKINVVNSELPSPTNNYNYLPYILAGLSGLILIGVLTGYLIYHHKQQNQE